MMRFVIWYLNSDYFPTRLSSRFGVLWNKSTYLLMFIAAFAAAGVLNGFRNKLKSKLNDPYFNSIPAYIGIAEIDEDSMFATYPGMRFDPYRYLGYNKTLKYHTNDTIYLRGISMAGDHPFFSMLEKHISHRSAANNFQNFKAECIIINKNTYRKLFDIHPDSLISSYPDTLSIRLLEAHVYLLGSTLTPVYAICDQLPLDMDFVLYDDFLERQNAKRNALFVAQVSEESKNYWKLIVEDDNIDFKILKQHGLAIKSFLMKYGRKDISTFPVESETPPGAIEVGFGLNKISTSAIRRIVDSMNLFLLNTDKYSGDSIKVLEEAKKNTAPNSGGDDVPLLKEWEYFTITPDKADKKLIYGFKNDFENRFKGVRLEMKSIDNVFFLDEVNSIVKILEFLFLTSILISSIIINYKTLTIHLHKKKNHIAYIKNLGVSLSVFKFIYVCEAFIETVLAVVAALLVSFVLNTYLKPDLFEFSFFSYEILAFTSFMLILTMLVYWFAINKLLSRSFRDIIENN